MVPRGHGVHHEGDISDRQARLVHYPIERVLGQRFELADHLAAAEHDGWHRAGLLRAKKVGFFIHAYIDETKRTCRTISNLSDT